MNLTLRVEQSGDHPILIVGGELDAYSSPRLKECLLPLVTNAETKSVTIDLAETSYIDSTGIGIFIGALKASRQTNCQLSFQNLTPRIERLFRITGLDEIIPVSSRKGEEA